jgi:hypothetical protein
MMVIPLKVECRWDCTAACGFSGELASARDEQWNGKCR